MRFLHLLPLAAVAASYVVVSEDVMRDVEIESHRDRDPISSLRKPCHDRLIEWKEEAEEIVETSKNYLDDALSKVSEVVHDVTDKVQKTSYDVESWLQGSPYVDDVGLDEEPHHPPHHGKPPHHKPPPHHRKPPHHGKPHSNLTIYQLISESKYTTKLAELIDEDEELVQILNGTKANYTLFAPTDKAFEKIPDHGKKPSKELIKKVLLYHISPDFYPAGRVLHSYTIPTLLEPEKLGHAERLTVRTTLKGLTINFYSKIVAVNIFGTNGVIHGVDSIILPPPRVIDIIELLPGEFSTLTLGLAKTGLLEKINASTEYPHEGGTFFAPSNFAFKKLGPKINAFLFSKYGTKYLKALLTYHIVVNQTLYSDAFFDASGDEESQSHPPYFHFDLPTVLHGKYLAVDVVRYGPFISIKINGFSKVTIHDGVANDGVIQVVSNVLIPPKPKPDSEELSFWTGEEMSVEDFKERLEPFTQDEENAEL